MSILAGPMKRELGEVDGLEDTASRSVKTKEDHHLRPPGRLLRGNVVTQGEALSSRTQSHRRRFSHSFAAPPSAPASRRPSPTALDAALQTPRKFEPNSSIVLIGIRGTGKSSLAVILSAAIGRRLVHADDYFEQATGLCRGAYKKEYGVAKYRQREAWVMESMLVEHKEGCVLDCGPGSMEQNGQRLLRDYAATHPVIHILRDPTGIQEYIKAWDTEKVRRLLTLSGPLYRECSNLEFFNVSVAGPPSGEDSHAQHESRLHSNSDEPFRTPTPFLTLKRVEHDFLRFITQAVGDSVRLTRPLDSFPLSKRSIESRLYTYAVSVPLSDMLARDLDIEELESTADAFELQIDVGADECTGKSNLDFGLADRISQTVATIRRSTIVPLIYHTHYLEPSRASSGDILGASQRSDFAYLNLVEHGLRFGPEFLTVDLHYSDAVISQIIMSKGQSRIIGHFSSLQSSPDSWDDPKYMTMYERAVKLGCDFVRLSQPAASMDDNFAVQRFQHKIRSLPGPHPPLIAYNSGSLGRLSCCFNEILTPVTHPSLKFDMHRNSTHPVPFITAHEARQALFSSFALDPMRFYVFGAHVNYSLSPAMHNAAYKACGMPHIYKIHQSSSITALKELVEDPHFGGSSLALPYKAEVIPLLDSMSSHAQAIGAVNTILPIRIVSPDGAITPETALQHERSRAGPVKALYGDNTDWVGIRNCIHRGLSPANAVQPWSTALVIGAGGMARAAIYGIIQTGVQNIFIYNRTPARARSLADHYNRQNLGGTGKVTVHVIESLSDPWPPNYKQPTIVVSGIPQHNINGQPAPKFELPEQWIRSPTGGVVIELAYKPLNTPLVKQMRSLSHQGWVALDGLDFLPEQGFAQFELFTGRRSSRRLMRATLHQAYMEQQESQRGNSNQ
ncbi:hypothetical protein AJ79_08794 [Helicocarpus griseus UAMH5409]|uniref:Uncharacterized protein n=1 Tax=Helicocarpus griseus UAMH5409 TaxID=1447875 RepID=A0A2B7WQ03_9EURO|nr:hypothetical protein AJ79_08794 [Helicocarpus griseus UAMH5409]